MVRQLTKLCGKISNGIPAPVNHRRHFPVMKKFILILFCVSLTVTLPAQVIAKKTGTLQTDADANGKASPGDTIRYTITITNTSGTNLLNVQFNDSFANQTL